MPGEPTPRSEMALLDAARLVCERGSLPHMRPRGFVSLGTKLAALTVGIVVVVSTIVYIELTGRERQSLIRSKVAAGAMVADLLATALVAPLDFGDAESLESELGYLR